MSGHINLPQVFKLVHPTVKSALMLYFDFVLVNLCFQYSAITSYVKSTLFFYLFFWTCRRDSETELQSQQVWAANFLFWNILDLRKNYTNMDLPRALRSHQHNTDRQPGKPMEPPQFSQWGPFLPVQDPIQETPLQSVWSRPLPVSGLWPFHFTE